MGLSDRFALFTRSKLAAALDRAEDPRELLEYGYQVEQEHLVEVRRGVVEVATARARLERESRRLREGIPQLEEQAAQALALGREDLARAALQRKHAVLTELDELEAQVVEVGAEERRLGLAQ